MKSSLEEAEDSLLGENSADGPSIQGELQLGSVTAMSCVPAAREDSAWHGECGPGLWQIPFCHVLVLP